MVSAALEKVRNHTISKKNTSRDCTHGWRLFAGGFWSFEMTRSTLLINDSAVVDYSVGMLDGAGIGESAGLGTFLREAYRRIVDALFCRRYFIKGSSGAQLGVVTNHE